jgi:hypothetical protein
MESIYCLKCKQKTKSTGKKIIGNRMTAKCAVCQTNKSSFLKKNQGGCGLNHDESIETFENFDSEKIHELQLIRDKFDSLPPLIKATYGVQLRADINRAQHYLETFERRGEVTPQNRLMFAGKVADVNQRVATMVRAFKTNGMRDQY